MYIINVEKTLNIPIEIAFERITDHENYQNFTGIDQSVLLKQGKETKNGVGALRKIKSGIFALEESITVYQAPKHMEYHITKSFPIGINHFLGRILLEQQKGKTKAVWRSEFEVTTPLLGRMIEKRLGPILERSFSKIFQQIEMK